MGVGNSNVEHKITIDCCCTYMQVVSFIVTKDFKVAKVNRLQQLGSEQQPKCIQTMNQRIRALEKG